MFDIVRQAVRANSTFIRISGVIYAIIVPVIVGVFAVYYEKLIEINPLLFWFPLVLFVGIACLYAYFFGGSPLAPEVYLDLEDSKKTIERLSSDIRYMSLLQEQRLAWNVLIRSYEKERVVGANSLKEAIATIIEPVVESRMEYFEFERNELWNFSIYLWSEE